MATKWTDEWVRSLPHPKPGEKPDIYPDPVLNGHRLVVRPTVKVFEFQRERPLQYGPRKTHKVQTGNYLTTTVEQSRTATIEGLARIARGEDPTARSLEPSATLQGVWPKFTERDVRPGTLRNFKNDWKILEGLFGSKTLKWLVDHPADVRDEHLNVTKDRGPSAADHAFRTLRACYNHAASLDTTLPRDRDPTSAVAWNGDRQRTDAAIPATQMPAWFAQVEALRKDLPVRASFHMLCLRLGMRPGELAQRRWSDVDLERKSMFFPVSKTESFEVPLPKQALAELKRLEDAKALNKIGNDFLFPSRGDDGRLKQPLESKDVLSHSGNSGRHTFSTQASLLGIDDKVRDVLQGRTLVKSGVAGSLYLDRGEFGALARKASQKINDRIDQLAKT